MADKSEERLALEARAKELEVEFAPNIGDKTLKARVEAAEAAAKPSSSGDAGATAPSQSDAQSDQSDTYMLPEAQLLEVIGPKTGFWRIGMKFTDQPRRFGPGELTDEQIVVLNDEPELKLKLVPANEE